LAQDVYLPGLLEFAMKDLKQRTVRGGLAKLSGQAANSIVRLGFLVVLARLLNPEDFGIVAMVTVVTNLLTIFANAGLGTGTIQSLTINNDQISTLFWINVLIGALLALLCLAAVPALVAFYHEPRLSWVMIAIASTFIVNGAGVQHLALLQREMRYVAIAVIDTVSQLAGAVIGIGMAFAGYGYWSLVVATIAERVVATAGVWIALPWIPGAPRRRSGLRPILLMGGTWTLNNVVVNIAYNLDKFLLGRFWGADALGLYGRANQVISVPVHMINGAVGAIVFSALSRLQDDPVRLKNYYLQSHSLVMSLTIPITIFSALFANEIVLIALGPKWIATVPIFRLMTPTVLIFGTINPLAWLLYSIGLQRRSLNLALVIAPLMTVASIVGLPYGPTGVAFANSAALALWLVPHVVWCLRGTVISPLDLLVTASRPLFSSVVAAGAAFGTQLYLAQFHSPFLELALGGCAMFATYVFMLLFVMGQKTLYLDLFRTLTGLGRPNASTH
jgi:O-antigen/teichoic acid export membrane protein